MCCDYIWSRNFVCMCIRTTELTHHNASRVADLLAHHCGRGQAVDLIERLGDVEAHTQAADQAVAHCDSKRTIINSTNDQTHNQTIKCSIGRHLNIANRWKRFLNS